MHGWLAAQPALGWTIEGIAIDPTTRTRNVEYAWAAEQLRASATGGAATLLDAASGYVPGWHMLPYIAAQIGYLVVASDLDERSLVMPPHPSIARVIDDITAISADDKSFDVVTCISVLEHMGREHAEMAAKELCRVARMRVIVTADEAPWLPDLFAPHAALGHADTFEGTHLNPTVYSLSCVPR